MDRTADRLCAIGRSPVVLLACCLVVAMASAGLDEESLLQEAETSAEVWLERMDRMEAARPLTSDDRDQVIEAMRWFARRRVGLSVGLLLGMGVAVYAVIVALMQRMRDWRVPISLSRFEPWDGLVWVFIPALAAVLLGDGQLVLVGWNVLIFAVLVYWVRGLGVVDFLMLRRAVPLPLRVLALGVVAMASPPQFLLLPTSAVGLFDTWFDFRRLSPEASAHGKETDPDEGGDSP